MFCYVANWKTYFSYAQEIVFFEKNKEAFFELAQNQKLIICPSFLSASKIGLLASNSALKIGAQNLSAHDQGAFTGEVAAQSLHEVGCSAVIIGHSESRKRELETDEILFKKIVRALNVDLLPLFCVGESLEEYETGASLAVIKKQLELLSRLKEENILNKKRFEIYIAYEPIFAIGTGVSASSAHIEMMIQGIKNILERIHLDFIDFSVLYGGSVSAFSIKELKQIPLVDGFLIGKSSTDFAEFKKIIDTLR